jgi:hypothetical protein
MVLIITNHSNIDNIIIRFTYAQKLHLKHKVKNRTMPACGIAAEILLCRFIAGQRLERKAREHAPKKKRKKNADGTCIKSH